MKKNQFEQPHECFEQSNQVTCEPNMTDHLPAIGDKLYKHLIHQKSLKRMLAPQMHETSWDVANGEELDSCDNLCIHYHSRGFLVQWEGRFATLNLQEDRGADH